MMLVLLLVGCVDADVVVLSGVKAVVDDCCC